MVYLCFAIAPNAENFIPQLVELLYYLLGGLAKRQVVSGSVVEQITQQKQAVCGFPAEGAEELGTIMGGTVNI